jgi:hypothetical protein
MESSHGCYEPYGDNHRSETSREFSHEGDILVMRAVNTDARVQPTLG